MKKWRRLLFAFAGAAVIGVNAIAFMHARSMGQFTPGGVRTESPESLGLAAKAKVLLLGVNVPRPEDDLVPSDKGMTFTSHHIDLPDDRWLEAWHIPAEQPRGLVVVFHGYASCKAWFLRDAEALHELNYDVLMVDFTGSGGSSGSTTTIGYHEADEVVATCEFVATEWPNMPPALYGHSMGAVAILRAASLNKIQPRAIILEGVFDDLLNTVENRFRTMGVPSFPFAELLVFWGGVQGGFPAFHHVPVDYAAATDVPALMLHGRDDPRALLSQAEAVFEQLPQGKKMVVFDSVGHESCCAAAPETWKQEVETFLRPLFNGT